MDKIVADILFGIGMLCIYGILCLQFARNRLIKKDINEIKKTACHALLDTDKLRLENVELSQKNIRLEARVLELEARMDSVKHWKFVGHWEEK